MTAPAAGPVRSSQRWSSSRPCPACGGWANLPAHKGERCHGYARSDGRVAFCSRPERAGNLDAIDVGDLWPHALGGGCGCGSEHGGAVPATAPRVTKPARTDEVARQLFNKANTKPSAAHVAYLVARGLDPAQLPPTIRYVDALKAPGGVVSPALVAMVGSAVSDSWGGVHRIFVTPEGAKIDRYSLGSIRGGCVALGRADSGVVAITEGIETGLAVQQSTGLDVWAALSTSGIRGLELPDRIREVIIVADADTAPAGKEYGPGLEAVRAAAARWTAQGIAVSIACTNDPALNDANDVLLRSGPEAVRALVRGAMSYTAPARALGPWDLADAQRLLLVPALEALDSGPNQYDLPTPPGSRYAPSPDYGWGAYWADEVRACRRYGSTYRCDESSARYASSAEGQSFVRSCGFYGCPVCGPATLLAGLHAGDAAILRAGGDVVDVWQLSAPLDVTKGIASVPFARWRTRHAPRLEGWDAAELMRLPVLDAGVCEAAYLVAVPAGAAEPSSWGYGARELVAAGIGLDDLHALQRAAWVAVLGSAISSEASLVTFLRLYRGKAGRVVERFGNWRVKPRQAGEEAPAEKAAPNTGGPGRSSARKAPRPVATCPGCGGDLLSHPEELVSLDNLRWVVRPDGLRVLMDCPKAELVPDKALAGVR